MKNSALVVIDLQNDITKNYREISVLALSDVLRA